MENKKLYFIKKNARIILAKLIKSLNLTKSLVKQFVLKNHSSIFFFFFFTSFISEKLHFRSIPDDVYRAFCYLHWGT